MRRHTVTRLLNLASVLLTAALVSPSGSFGQERDSGRELSSTLAKLEWRNIGPAFTSGRIADIVSVDTDRDTIYVATATGGVWKSTNRGSTWKELFKDRGTASLGAIAVAPSNPNIVWLGSGEAQGWRSTSWGDGVYKSEDAGKTWEHMGLEETRHTGKIVIHPGDPDIVYVAGMGALWGSNEERGLFKTTDGGVTWEKVLYISELTGVSDLAMDPRDSDLLYAAAWQRARRNWSSLFGGPEGGLYRSTNGGESWVELTNGLPEGDVGRIGLSICRSQPDTIYATIQAREHDTGLYRSDDRGASWERRNEIAASSKVRCDPKNPERVYLLRNGDSVSEDGGRTLSRNYAGPGVHVDQQAMWIDPNDPEHIIIGNDGGVYLTDDRAESWEFVENLPVTQYYTVGVDLQEPFYYVYGGTQDNNSMGGPSGTRYTDGIANEDWYVTTGGDGFYVRIDPEEPTIVYTESQYGRLVRFDTVTGERRLIQPAHPEDGKYRWNWSSPVHISYYDNETLYFSANVVFKSPDRGDTWEVISPDLTRQISHFDLPLQGEVQPLDAIGLHRGTSDYGNITTFSESPLRQGLLVVGTDDGLIQVTRDDGGTWVPAEIPSTVPEMTRVSCAFWSQHDEGTLYATFDGHKDNNFLPYLYKSNDYGSIWSNITGDLPELGSTRVLVEHPRNPNLLFVGTEFQVLVSINGGGRWVSLKNNMPTVPVHDMVIQPQKNDLVIGTHGRGFWILDDITILEELSEEVLASEVHLASVRPAMQMHKFNRGRGSMGHTHYTAPNPPDGAILTYYINPGVMEVEGLAKEGPTDGDNEDRAASGKAPKVDVDILDSDDRLVRRLEAPQAASGTGVQRLVWDLRHPLSIELGPEERTSFLLRNLEGPYVLPGVYQVRLRVGQKQQTRSVEVHGDVAIEISAADRRVWHDTLVALNDMMAASRAVMSTSRQVEERLGVIRGALTAHGEVTESIEAAVKEIDDEVKEILLEMEGEEEAGGAQQRGAPPLNEQIQGLYVRVEATTALPTADQRRLTRRSHERLGQQIERIEGLVIRKLPALERQLDAAGIRWTPGRPISLPSTSSLPSGR